MGFLASLIASLFLAACGMADVGTSAATAGKMKAEQVKQGQETINQMNQKLESAGQAAEADKRP